jgi:sulfofructose kinase
MRARPNATSIQNGRSDVVGLGLNAMDYITVVEKFPQPLTKVRIREIRLEPGGQVATALVTCRRLGLTVRYIGSVGSDDLGRRQLSSLVDAGIDTAWVRIAEGSTTQLAIAIVEENVGERTILWHRDPGLTYPPSLVSEAMIRSGRLLHLDGRDSAASLKAARIAKRSGMPIVIDIDKRYDETTEQLLSLVDYLIAAEEFALELTGESDPGTAAVRLSERFPQALTGVTMGDRGATFVRHGQPVRFPAFDVPVRDTTGAGDVFHGAFIFGLLRGWELERTARFANAAAAIKCTDLGARNAIPTLEEAMRFLETAREKSI